MSSMDMYRIRNNTILEGRIHTERLRAKAEVAYERERKELELEQQRIAEKIKESQDKILEKDSQIEELINRNIELESAITKESTSNNFFRERYDAVMQRGNDLVNEYPYILRADDSGMIMVDSDSAIHLKELNSKFENNIL
ncbi:hypothetical protein [Serratia sp. CY37869]|uniref:hypothetical protein n=1 Tax=Serratia sp. CY37869 TaxID=3383612 RepID=UPI003FA0D3D3